MVKKQLIIEKSLELFAKQGFSATSVQQITELCGISKGAFYLAFKSKDELITGIIDYFMEQFIVDIDRSVRECRNKEEMLYEFYYTTFHSFARRANFARIFIKEQALPFDEELLLKFNQYDRRLNRIILYMLEQLYGDEHRAVVYDLLIIVKGFVHSYEGFNLHYGLQPDMDLFVRSLVEKTNILASHVTLPFVTEEMHERMTGEPLVSDETVESERIALLIDQKLQEIEDPIELESLAILKQNLMSASSSPAVTKGLLENIKSNPQCRWIAYLIREHYQL